MQRHSVVLHTVATFALAAATLGACSKEGAHDDDSTTVGDTASAAAAVAPSGPVIGRCAVDARDGASYGRITADSVDASSGAHMYTIEAPGGAATWHKASTGVKVVDCPAP